MDITKNMSSDDIDTLKQMCSGFHDQLVKASETETSEDLLYAAGVWEKFCQNLGVEGFEWM